MSSINVDARTVSGFGAEWSRFDYSRPNERAELRRVFEQYFSEFPWNQITKQSVGFDLGCGTGRWAAFVAPRVGTLHCIDASADALGVARRNLSEFANCEFHNASVDAIPLPDCSMDFGFSLGVLHHIPDTLAGIKSCTRKLKPGAPFLVYLYYALETRGPAYRALNRLSDAMRFFGARLPVPMRLLASHTLAATVYLPLSRTARVFERVGVAVENIPLSAYRDKSFYVMQTDALDRFTAVVHRFTRDQIARMLEEAGLERIRFRDGVPYWCAVGFKR